MSEFGCGMCVYACAVCVCVCSGGKGRRRGLLYLQLCELWKSEWDSETRIMTQADTSGLEG